MSRLLELPDPLFAALEAAATAKGLTPAEWIALHLLPNHGVINEGESHPRGSQTLADLFAGRVGRIHSGGKEGLSDHCGTQFTDALEEKRSAGHL